MFLQNSPFGSKVINEDCIGITKGIRPKLIDVPCETSLYDGKKLLPLCQRNEIKEKGINAKGSSISYLTTIVD